MKQYTSFLLGLCCYISTAQQVYWSEDFSNGIPSTWTNEIYDASGAPINHFAWEYRPISTQPPQNYPDGSWGSKGRNSGQISIPPFNTAILSPTGANGFAIFDSDYLTHGEYWFGMGPVAQPHSGILTTDTINMSQKSSAILEFYSHSNAQTCFAYIEYSTDGGLTWGNADTINSPSTYRHARYTPPNALRHRIDLTPVVSNQSNVMLRFVFDASHTYNGEYGLSYWMIDDIKIMQPPANRLEFVGPTGERIHLLNAQNNQNLAPRVQSAYLNDPVEFAGYVQNTGASDLSNVKLMVDIYDSNGNIINTVQSSTTSLIAGEKSALLKTTSFLMNTFGEYTIEAYAISDQTTKSDFEVDSSYMARTSNWWGPGIHNASNQIHTYDLDLDFGQIAVRLDPNMDINIESIRLALGDESEEGAVADLYIIEAAGYDSINGMPGTVLGYQQAVLDAASISNGYWEDVFYANSNVGVNLQSGSYFLVLDLYNQGGAMVINLENDLSSYQPKGVTINRDSALALPPWYSDFYHAWQFTSLNFELKTKPYISVEEELAQSVRVFPNPTSDYIRIESDLVPIEEVRILNLKGQVLMHIEDYTSGNSIDLTQLANGTCLVELYAEDERIQSQLILIQK